MHPPKLFAACADDNPFAVVIKFGFPGSAWVHACNQSEILLFLSPLDIDIEIAEVVVLEVTSAQRRNTTPIARRKAML
jgi:hypothetical protein